MEAEHVDDRHAAHRILRAHPKRVLGAAMKCHWTFDFLVDRMHDAISCGDIDPSFVLSAVPYEMMNYKWYQ